jgi:hypothetical protein
MCLPDIYFNNIHNKPGEEKEGLWLHVAVFFLVKFHFHERVGVIKRCEQYCVYFPVTARIRNLHDYQLRLLHNIMPVPSGVDIANTLKYFSQTLLSKCTHLILLFLHSNNVNP